MVDRERIDVLLVKLGFFDSRESAKRAVMSGVVLVNDERIDKPGEKVLIDGEVRIKGDINPYVSRGGLKLEKALKEFDIDLDGRIVIDVGASTGGFTDCALQNGASFSYAIDVGYNQLAWKLRQDDRVLSLERTNFRYMNVDDLKHGRPQFACMDVSFISIKLLLPTLEQMLDEFGEIVALIKPQFEAGRDLVGKKGIVRDSKVHVLVVKEIVAFVRELGLVPRGLTYSPVKGGEGNIEFLIHIGRVGVDVADDVLVEKVVKAAHTEL